MSECLFFFFSYTTFARNHKLKHNIFKSKFSLLENPVLIIIRLDADLVQMLQIALSDPGIHCLFTRISLQVTIKMKTFI